MEQPEAMSQPASSTNRPWFKDTPYQNLAFLFCFLFGITIVINVQLAGDAEWFFYAGLLRKGVKLYADLHLPLQPFFVLEIDAWMHLVGQTCLAYESISLVHLFLFCLAMYLILQESPWPDWRKAILFVGAFFVNFFFVGLRFDDFHVVCDICALYTVWALLRLNRERVDHREVLWAIATGVLSGISYITRSTEGAMLLAGAGACIPFLAQRRRLASTVVHFAVAVAIILTVIHITGDTLHDYAVNSVMHAAAAKGGNSFVFLTPLRAFVYTLLSLRHNRGTAWVGVLLGAGVLTRKYWKDTPGTVITVELISVLLLLMTLASVPPWRKDLFDNAFTVALNVLVQNAIYPLLLYILYRFLRSRWSRLDSDRASWNAREILIVLVVTNLVAVAASQGIGTSNGTFGIVMLLLLPQLWLSVTGHRRWLADSLVAIALVVALTGAVAKVHTPYAWGNYASKPMFEGRQWYRHPVYGPMYVESDLLHFIEPVCNEVRQSDAQPELLSLPYSYANYFCVTPPWRNYVQTWFDTTAPSTVQTLMDQLNAAPPKFILYQRQLTVLRYHEIDYNHGQPVIHRKLDELIMGKLTSNQWKLIDRRNYLPGDGWYLIQTHP